MKGEQKIVSPSLCSSPAVLTVGRTQGSPGLASPPSAAASWTGCFDSHKGEAGGSSAGRLSGVPTGCRCCSTEGTEPAAQRCLLAKIKIQACRGSGNLEAALRECLQRQETFEQRPKEGEAVRPSDLCSSLPRPVPLAPVRVCACVCTSFIKIVFTFHTVHLGGVYSAAVSDTFRVAKPSV